MSSRARLRWLPIWVLGLSLASAASPQAPPARTAFDEGRALLAQSDALAQASRQAILAANKTRQDLNSLRARQSAGPQAAPALNDLAQRLERQQTDGARWRADSEALRQRAMQRLTEGLVGAWGRWVRDTRPLTIDGELGQLLAHNARLRSVHPGQPVPVRAVPGDEVIQDRGMSLRLPVLVAQRAPPDLDIAAFQLSRDRHYLAHIEVHGDADTTPGNASAVPLNRMHRWRLLVSDLAGQPLAGAKVSVGGHMPGHVHGLPTQPRVTQELAPGVYLVEGLKFQMEGWWVMQFEVQPADAALPADNVAFNLVL